MNKDYAYATYLDKKAYLPGLCGLYYSLMKHTIYDLIVIYSGEIEEKDIWNYIPKERTILLPVPTYEVSLNMRTDTVEDGLDVLQNPMGSLNGIYNHWQNSNIIGPLYIYNLIEYKIVMYLHCDVIIKKDLDHLFDEIENGYDIYVPEYFKRPEDERIAIHSTRFSFYRPNKNIFNYIMNNINYILKNKYIVTIDGVLSFLSYGGIIKVKQIQKDHEIDSHMFHSGGVFKYWILFPKMDIKEFAKSNDESRFDIIGKKQKQIMAQNFKVQINNSIWKDDHRMVDLFNTISKNKIIY